jgi:hypothetical protein
MTEAEWLVFEDPLGVLESIADKVSERKLRLFAAACCRRVEYLFLDEDRRKCLDVVDRWAEGLASVQELEAAISAARAGWEPERETEIIVRENAVDALLLILRNYDNPLEAARGASLRTRYAASASGKSHTDEGKAQVRMLRDIVGDDV